MNRLSVWEAITAVPARAVLASIALPFVVAALLSVSGLSVLESLFWSGLLSGGVLEVVFFKLVLSSRSGSTTPVGVEHTVLGLAVCIIFLVVSLLSSVSRLESARVALQFIEWQNQNCFEAGCKSDEIIPAKLTQILRKQREIEIKLAQARSLTRKPGVSSVTKALESEPEFKAVSEAQSSLVRRLEAELLPTDIRVQMETAVWVAEQACLNAGNSWSIGLSDSGQAYRACAKKEIAAYQSNLVDSMPTLRHFYTLLVE